MMNIRELSKSRYFVPTIIHLIPFVMTIIIIIIIIIILKRKRKRS